MEDYEKLLNYTLRLLIKKRYTTKEIRKKISSLLEVSAKESSASLRSKFRCSLTTGSRLHSKSASRLVSNTFAETYLDKSPENLAENNQAVIDRIITRLEELNYINDEQFVADYINDRIRFKPRGRYLLIQELKKKGISEETVLNFLNKTEIDEKQMAVTILEKKENQWRGLDMQKKKIKACRLLISKGFNTDTVYKAIDRWYNPDVLE